MIDVYCIDIIIYYYYHLTSHIIKGNLFMLHKKNLKTNWVQVWVKPNLRMQVKSIIILLVNIYKSSAVFSNVVYDFILL